MGKSPSDAGNPRQSLASSNEASSIKIVDKLRPDVAADEIRDWKSIRGRLQFGGM